MKQIIFYAPLGYNTPPERIGGAEAGCLRTLEIYENAGYKVNIIQKPALSQGKIHSLYLQPVITQYFVRNKSEICHRPLRVHSKG